MMVFITDIEPLRDSNEYDRGYSLLSEYRKEKAARIKNPDSRMQSVAAGLLLNYAVGKWIATAECVEVRFGLPMDREIEYAVAATREKHRIASENPLKVQIVKELIDKYPEDKILVIGQFLSQLDELSKELGAPIITGKTKNAERAKILAADYREI